MKKLITILMMAFAVVAVSCSDKTTEPKDDRPTYVADLAFDVANTGTLLPADVKVVDGGFTATLNAATGNAVTLTELSAILDAYQNAFEAKNLTTTSLAKINLVDADISSTDNKKTITIKIVFADNTDPDNLKNKHTATVVLKAASADKFNVILDSEVDVTIPNPNTPNGVTYTGGPIKIENGKLTSTKLVATVAAGTTVTYGGIATEIQAKLLAAVTTAPITGVTAVAVTTTEDNNNVTGAKYVTLNVLLVSDTHVFEGNGLLTKSIDVPVSFVKK